MRNLALSVLGALLLSACIGQPTPQPTPLEERRMTFIPDNGNFQVERAGLIDDELAYGKKRVVYVLTDVETGVQYLGVSGLGMVERRKVPADGAGSAKAVHGK